MRWRLRKSIRPINLRRIIETTSFVAEKGAISDIILTKRLGTSERQARAILRELVRMNILEAEAELFQPTINAQLILDFYNREDWEGIHNLLLENYDFYNVFVDEIAKGDPSTIEELLDRLSPHQDLVFNHTSLDILSDWAERLGRVQRNLYNNRYYLLGTGEIDIQTFSQATEECYFDLNTLRRPGTRIVYIEIARLRESVCENLRIGRDLFDVFLERLFLGNIGKIDLSGAPLTTSAKESPTSLRLFERGGKEDILSPQYRTIREGKGLEVREKLYHYIGIFEKLES